MTTPVATVARVADLIEQRYVFRDVGLRTAQSLRRIGAERWEAVRDEECATVVTEHLQEQTGDAHLRLRWTPEDREATGDDDWSDPEFLAAYWRDQDYVNQGLSRAEVLDGNVGLLVCHSVDEAEGTGHVVDAALAFLARCDALIVDVRESNGGAPSGVAYLVSHFVEPPARHLLDIIDRDGHRVEQTWTTPFVRTRLSRQPLFVLTSSRTPSGTEELAYDLQSLGRATVVGETTVGAANPVQRVVVGPHLFLQLPTLRVVNGVTGGNWEGVGVVPDTPCRADVALSTAHALAARALLDSPDRASRPEAVREALHRVADTSRLS